VKNELNHRRNYKKSKKDFVIIIYSFKIAAEWAYYMKL
jgi:hypothetical protein